MFGFLKKKVQPVDVFFTASLNARIMPLDRGSLFEDPLNEILIAQGIGEVTGGGTMVHKSGEVDFADLEIKVNDSSTETAEKIIKILEDLGAPKGSTLRIEASGAQLNFGITEGLAIYLNGIDLPREVYESTDVDFVCDEFTRLLSDEGKLMSYWQGPTETALYMYGTSFESMKSKLIDFVSEYPLCAKSRIVQIA